MSSSPLRLRSSSLVVACILIAAALVACALPRKPAAGDTGTVLQESSKVHASVVPSNEHEWYRELKALAVSRRTQSRRTQQLAEAPSPKTAAQDTKPCDAECQHMKKVGKDRMRALRDEIDNDFDGMIAFGEDSSYVPPVESIEEQVKDGTLYGEEKSDVKEPPAAFSGGAIVAEDPGASRPVLKKNQVQDVAKLVKDETPSADDLLGKIQNAEAQVQGTNPMRAAVDNDDETVEPHHSKGLPAGVTFGNEAAPAASTTTTPPDNIAPDVAAAPVFAPGAIAPQPAAAPAPITASQSPVVSTPAVPAESTSGPVPGVVSAAAATSPVEQPASNALAPSEVREQASQVAAPAVPAAPAASSEESRGVLDNFPHVGPAFAEPSAPAPEDNAEAAARHEAEWRKAFAFVGQTDNPVVGNNGQANTLQVAGSVQQSSAQAISSSGSSPLDDDGFLKGFWGSS
jgi:hypothetical protein